MIDRRSFINCGVALAAAAVSWPLRDGATAPTARASPTDPEIAFVDRLLEGAERFAANARARGLHVLEFSSDAAGVWMRDLEPRLRAGSVTIAGYTSAATLFCLDVLARDYGARMVKRRENGGAVTWLISSSPMRCGALAPSNRTRRG